MVTVVIFVSSKMKRISIKAVSIVSEGGWVSVVSEDDAGRSPLGPKQPTQPTPAPTPEPIGRDAGMIVAALALDSVSLA